MSPRPYLMTYQGVRIDQSEELWSLYVAVAASDDAQEVAAAKTALYSIAGAGGWDDVCARCELHRYEHTTNHYFISEEQ